MKRIMPILFAFVIIFALSSCAGQDGAEIDQNIAQSVAATQTKRAWEASVEDARGTDEASQADSEESAEPTPEPEISHQMQPEESHKELANTYLTDFNSIDYAEEGITYGDQFFMNRYERPFTVEMTEYRGYLDIILAEMFVTPPWVYVDVNLADDLPESSTAIYSLELDSDIDDRGDFLIQSVLPPDENWTVAGVTVLEDSNEDVGGAEPLLAENLPEDLRGDGYDRVLFDSGRGEDPDLAWVRRNPEDPTMLQFAFKSSLTDNTGFLWSVWADDGLRDPGMRDYNDRFSFEQAGSPYPDHQFYPIQEINLLDSTCRSWYGFEPQGDEGGLCQVYVKDTGGDGYKLCYTYSTGSVSFTRCSDVCSPSCPATGQISDQLAVFCRRCKLPE